MLWGWFESKILKFGNVTLTNKTDKGSDMYVAKFSPKGECIWAKNAGGEGKSGNYSTIVLDNENNVFIGGIVRFVMDFGNGIKLTSEKAECILPNIPIMEICSGQRVL